MSKAKQRKERILKGLCPECGGQMDREGWACVKCTKEGNERKKIWANNRVGEGRCPSCREGKIIQGTTYCPECKDKLLRKNKGNKHKYHRKYTTNDLLRVQRKRKGWKKLGLCQGCGKVEVKKYYCNECKKKVKTRQERWRKNNA